jgi:fatty acid synthase
LFVWPNVFDFIFISGLAAVTKLIIGMEDKMMPANLHYESPNPDIPGLVDGRLQVVTNRIPVHGGLIGVNCFGCISSV